MWIGTAKREQCVERVRRSLAHQLDIGDGKAGLVRGREPAHLQALSVGGDCSRSVRRIPGGHEDDLVQVGAFDRRLGGTQMPEVDRNSAVPMRTV